MNNNLSRIVYCINAAINLMDMIVLFLHISIHYNHYIKSIRESTKDYNTISNRIFLESIQAKFQPSCLANFPRQSLSW
jgi:hypothetical protein